MSNYDVSAANTNRHTRFFVEPNAAADKVANVFRLSNGVSPSYPFYGRDTDISANEELQQLRVSLIVRAMSAYAPVVGVQLANNSDGEANGAIIVTFETWDSGVFFRNAW